MSKEADVIQIYNDIAREFEYSVKGYNITKSVKILLKAHKEAYDNERRIFAECKGFIDAEKEFKQTIADLEAKLAESEKKIEKAKRTAYSQRQSDDDIKIRALKTDVANKENCIKELKQQLAEKEKEIEVLKLDYDFVTKQYNELIEKGNYIINQDKISFAVERLGKVKKFVIRQLFITTKGCSDLDEAEAKGCNELREETIKEIDKQITQLKEMK